MDLRKQFEKETGMVAHYQDPNNEDIYTQFSYEYSEWLENLNNKLDFDNAMVMNVNKHLKKYNEELEAENKQLKDIVKGLLEYGIKHEGYCDKLDRYGEIESRNCTCEQDKLIKKAKGVIE